MKICDVSTKFYPRRILSMQRGKVIYEEAPLQHITGSIYGGKLINRRDMERPPFDHALFFWSEDAAIGVELERRAVGKSESLDNRIENLQNTLFTTGAGFTNWLSSTVQKEQTVPELYIELAKHIAPANVESAITSGQEDADLVRDRLTNWHQELEEFANCKNETAWSQLDAAKDILTNGSGHGSPLYNDCITFFKSKNESVSDTLLNWLFKQYNINIHQRTAAWIRTSIEAVDIYRGRLADVYYRPNVADTYLSEYFVAAITKLAQSIKVERQVQASREEETHNLK